MRDITQKYLIVAYKGLLMKLITDIGCSLIILVSFAIFFSIFDVSLKFINRVRLKRQSNLTKTNALFDKSLQKNF
jgi:hypothetical protein